MINEAILPKIKSGATVKVYEKVKEGDKERLSQFSGMVIARKHGSEPGAHFTVRATVAGVGVEKVYPLYSPLVEKVEIVNSPKKVSGTPSPTTGPCGIYKYSNPAGIAYEII